MKKMKKLLGIVAIAAIIGLGMTACDNGSGGGGTGGGGNGGGGGGGGGNGTLTFNITNNHSVAIKSAKINSNGQNFTKDVSIAASGGTGSVTFTGLNTSIIGTIFSGFGVTFTDDTTASGGYATTGTSKQSYNAVITGTGTGNGSIELTDWDD